MKTVDQTKIDKLLMDEKPRPQTNPAVHKGATDCVIELVREVLSERPMSIKRYYEPLGLPMEVDDQIELGVKAVAALSPFACRQDDVDAKIELCQKHGHLPSYIKFDIPSLYQGELDSSGCALQNLFDAASWTLSVLTQIPGLKHGNYYFGDWSKGEAVTHMAGHFEALENTRSRIHWASVGDPSTMHPEFILQTDGLDTVIWRLILEMFKETRNWRKFIGLCKYTGCRRLFTRTTTRNRYCGKTCSDRQRQNRWKIGGGLDERKKKRAEAKDNLF